jgi:hypothetical protein
VHSLPLRDSCSFLLLPLILSLTNAGIQGRLEENGLNYSPVLAEVRQALPSILG